MEADQMDANDQGDLPMTNIAEPSDMDVVCGRGGAAHRHPGNKTYRTLVQLNKGLYITCVKSEKLKISKSIVAAIREMKGRFLEKNKDGTYDDIGDRKATEKTSQALREGQPKLKQQIAEFGGNAAAAMAQTQVYYSPPQAPRHSYSSSDGNLTEAAAFAFNEYSTYETQQKHSIDQHTTAAFRNHSFLRNNIHNSLSPSATDMPPPPVANVLNQLSQSNLPEEDNINRMRPSLLQRGSVIAHELGVDPQSSRSLMSDCGNFGMADSSHSLDTGSRQSLMGLDLSYTAAAAAEQEKVDFLQNASVVDRRRLFARMKFNRMTSGRASSASGRMSSSSGRNADSMFSLGDGMPDIHLVESNRSLCSNISSIGEPGDPLESRSIFSDLSKKIGNVSTRSITSELSNMEDIDSSVSTPEKLQPQRMTSSSMDLE